ncbi:type I secretion system ATPase family protein [Yersinia pseudotuberculosis IP 32953]|uniref:Alpha-hemolysin translocation ATP-binding protein HlyB n=1 Tax=Yersinia pseudotuberculosis serotype I (strain IP32953) TaxID=273123 RepID=Q66AF9_YERPS|nr:type I secretion system permease/ATPase [Yersinia pseudotuberculosis]CQD47775.1 putative toxin transport protein [Yersinia intermedia]AJJ01217.1 type I secretion system ATPase family protein [Yersinia pseudotuberculosis]AJJ54198.1 type I secretion system ATPase family protein [Yersinia pseudotuberculosis IP 32953]AJJ69095.1 type I secretion system ATPase family protein [Yersinia pseudotuberculosis PB1/+]AYX14226.1 type I secretion system permease/ATPase [Yersinia pseudotuberculosis]
MTESYSTLAAEGTKVIQPLEALAYAATCFDLTIEASQLAHQLGLAPDEIDSIALCRCAAWIGLRARKVNQSFERVGKLVLPVLFSDGAQWYVLLSLTAQEATVYFAGSDQTRKISPEVLAKLWRNEVILLAKAEPITAKKQFFGFSWFIPVVMKSRHQLRNIILISLLLQAILLVTPMLFETVIDKVLVSRGVDSLVVLGGAMVALAIAEPGYTLLRSWLFAHLSSRVGAELNTQLYRHLLGLPLGYFTGQQTGQTIAKMREMEQIRSFLTGSALTMVLDLFFVVTFIAVMFRYSGQLTGIVLISLLCYLLFWSAVGGRLRKRVAQQYETSAQATSFLTEAVSGVETIKTSATESQFNRRWRQVLARYVRASFGSSQAGNLAGQGISLINKITSAILLWFGVTLVLAGKLSPGELVAFNMFAGYVTQPILRLAQAWQDFQHTQIALERIGTILDSPTEPGSAGLVANCKRAGSLSFKQVRFRYRPDTAEVLQNLNLEIAGGEFIGITGPSGCGKSTLTKLMQRLYTPQHGQILVDGQDLAITDPTTLRRQMSVVLQESVLFSGSIRDNICQCRPNADEAHVIHIARLAGAHDFIIALPQGYQTQVGEKGGLLSGGQRQRIALARALMADPKILILDEATSALDYESEAAIMRQLPEITRNRTVICIAHRLNTLRQCHRILLLKDGQIAEQGSHEVLVASGGNYARLWQQQTE